MSYLTCLSLIVPRLPDFIFAQNLSGKSIYNVNRWQIGWLRTKKLIQIWNIGKDACTGQWMFCNDEIYNTKFLKIKTLLLIWTIIFSHMLCFSHSSNQIFTPDFLVKSESGYSVYVIPNSICFKITVTSGSQKTCYHVPS